MFLLSLLACVANPRPVFGLQIADQAWSSDGDCDYSEPEKYFGNDGLLTSVYTGNVHYFDDPDRLIRGRVEHDEVDALWEYEGYSTGLGTWVGDITGNAPGGLIVSGPGSPITLAAPVRAHSDTDSTIERLGVAASEASACDYDGDGALDLCTDIGVALHPVGEAYDLTWDEVTSRRPTVADLDGDGMDEVYLWRANRIEEYRFGQAVRDLPLVEALRGPPVVADIDHDGVDELIQTAADGTVHVFDATTFAGSAPERLPGSFTGAVRAVAELDGQSTFRELVFQDASQVRVHSVDGNLLARWERPPDGTNSRLIPWVDVDVGPPVDGSIFDVLLLHASAGCSVYRYELYTRGLR